VQGEDLSIPPQRRTANPGAWLFAAGDRSGAPQGVSGEGSALQRVWMMVHGDPDE